MDCAVEKARHYNKMNLDYGDSKQRKQCQFNRRHGLKNLPEVERSYNTYVLETLGLILASKTVFATAVNRKAYIFTYLNQLLYLRHNHVFIIKHFLQCGKTWLLT